MEMEKGKIFVKSPVKLNNFSQFILVMITSSIYFSTKLEFLQKRKMMFKLRSNEKEKN